MMNIFYKFKELLWVQILYPRMQISPWDFVNFSIYGIISLTQKKIIFFGRYIDDNIIIWDGSKNLVTEFAEHYNNNRFKVSSMYVVDAEKLAFLDLEVGHKNNQELEVSTIL